MAGMFHPFPPAATAGLGIEVAYATKTVAVSGSNKYCIMIPGETEKWTNSFSRCSFFAAN